MPGTDVTVREALREQGTPAPPPVSPPAPPATVPDWTRYRQQCYTAPIGGNYDRAWFAMLVPNGMPSNAAAGCTAYYSGMESDCIARNRMGASAGLTLR